MLTLISNNVQIANAVGAFVIGFMANLYSRLRHGLAAVAMLPSIFVVVPGTLAASGGLFAGITSADQIKQQNEGASVAHSSSQALDVGYNMVQLAIGISVGLFLSALLVYPLGKRRSGLFSF